LSAFASVTALYVRYLVLIFILATSWAGAQTRALSLPLDSQWTPVRAAPRTTVKPDIDAKDAGLIVAKPILPPTRDTSLAVPLDRLLVGVGDQIFITVFGQTDMSAEVTVNDNSQVTLPLIGTLTVGGLTPPTIEKLIAQRLRDGEYLRNPEVSVQVKQVRSQMISVLGEVQRPGRFPILGKLTVLDALATAGGLGPKADRTVFLLRRNPVMGEDRQRLEIAIKLDQVIDAGRGELDVELKNDDVVFVAQQKLFYIHGEVRRPGAYPMEVDLDVMRVLSLSGGVTERGSLRRIRILRKDADQKTQEISATLSSPVMGGDVVYVDERFF